MSKVIRVFTFCLIAIVIITGLNYYVDSYLSIRVTYDSIGQMSEKSNYYVGTDIPISERKAKWARINRMRKQRCLVLGSSRMLMFTKEDMQKDSFYNMSVSGGSCVQDYLAETYILYSKDKLPNEMFIEINPATFNANNVDNRYTEWGDNAEYMAQMLDGLKVDVTSTSLGIQWRNLVSPAYFQYNFQNLMEGKRVCVEETNNEDHPLFAVTHVDGSYMYSESYQSQYSEEEIIKETENICSSKSVYYCNGFNEIDSRLKGEFEKLIAFLQKEDVKVSFYLPPYSEQMYQFIIQEDDYKMIPKVEEYILALAEKREITVYGSYDPENSGLSTADFYDPYHIRREKIMDTLWRRN